MSFLSDRRSARKKRQLARLNPKQFAQTVSDSLNMLIEVGLIEMEMVRNKRTYRITALGNAVLPGMDEAERRGVPITKELIQQLIDDVRK